MHFYDDKAYLPNPVVKLNAYLSEQAEPLKVPDFTQAETVLPAPTWSGHNDEISCWSECWRKMFEHIIPATAENRFRSPCVDTVFNGNVFLWDTVMTLQYAKYGERAFPVRGSLDNFYARQHPDGFICREVSSRNGEECWSRHDPCSTGPDIFAWGEWDLYRLSGDRKRLERVLPALLGYFYWMRAYRSFPDGSRWYTGWGGGLDNQPRQGAELLPHGAAGLDGKDVPVEYYWFLPGRMSWIDATSHALLAADTIVKMIKETGAFTEHLPALEAERKLLRTIIHEQMWNEKIGFYVDRFGDGTLSDVKSIVGFWVLLTEDVPKERAERMAEHLSNPEEFARPHRVPTLSADNPLYDRDGGYWRGGVWPPTTYMVVRGLQKQGFYDLAGSIALNHIANVTEVYRNTGTVWENYAPEKAAPGNPSKPDMLGWSGLGPIALLIEALFGIEIDAPAGVVHIRPTILDEFSIDNLPFGPEGRISIHCLARRSFSESLVVKFESDCGAVPVIGEQ